jgi:hypothetical protein
MMMMMMMMMKLLHWLNKCLAVFFNRPALSITANCIKGIRDWRYSYFGGVICWIREILWGVHGTRKAEIPWYRRSSLSHCNKITVLSQRFPVQ